MLGLGSEYKSQLGNILPVPNWLYEHLERWHYLSFLKTRKNLDLLGQIRFQALEPEKIGALIELVDHDLGYRLYQAVEQTKCRLSEGAVSDFHFHEAEISINDSVRRDIFERLDRSGTRTDQRLCRAATRAAPSYGQRRGRGLHDRRFLLRAGDPQHFPEQIWRRRADPVRPGVHVGCRRFGDLCFRVVEGVGFAQYSSPSPRRSSFGRQRNR